MERRPSPWFLKLVVAGGLAVALITAAVRADPGGLGDLVSFNWIGGQGCDAYVTTPPPSEIRLTAKISPP